MYMVKKYTYIELSVQGYMSRSQSDKYFDQYILQRHW